MNTEAIVAIALAIVAIVAAGIALLQTRKTKRLRSRFGPEYDHLAESEGERRAQAELANREARVKKLPIRELTPEERVRFARAWQDQQAQFVEDPRRAVSEADILVSEVMSARGYPAADFHTQLADVSVNHAYAVSKYREAHNLAERNRHGEINTEELRHAMICYRALFEDLLGRKVVQEDEIALRGR